ncbi:MAG: CDP-alcohol phosphatidyltransferase family protein [Candidatus Marinimicrobia bacterium]|nr:CDP-alcohol phosphatidyltransferase family protein [Candidatus Neomarinimicrobiota bacterium]
MSKKYIPNILTFGRIFLTPLFLYFLFANIPHGKLIALVIFIGAALTDLFDGKFARKHGLVTKLGIFMDPLADKFLVLSAFVSFWITGEVQLWMLVLTAFRDVLVTALRMLMQFRGFTMITSKVGKWKTGFQITVIIIIMLYLIINSYDLGHYISFISEFKIIYFLMVVTSLITAYTGVHYFYYNYQTLKLLFSKK